MDSSTLFTNSPSLVILTRHTIPTKRHYQIFLPQRCGPLRFNPISCSSSSSDSRNTNNDDDLDSVQPPPGAVGVRFKRRSRRQSRQQKENGAVSSSNVQSNTKAKVLETTSPKKWEEMNLTEKALELYMGEKGALFWLNKFAYASIFIMIGAWIFFRFVGPALNLYQLDAPPLSPSSVFKGSS